MDIFVVSIFGYYECCCCENLYITFCVHTSFHFSQADTEEYMSNDSSMLVFLKNCQTVFQNGYTIWHYHQHLTQVSIPWISDCGQAGWPLNVAWGRHTWEPWIEKERQKQGQSKWKATLKKIMWMEEMERCWSKGMNFQL